MPSHVLGLTGGIACGKSTVANMFAQLGAVHVDADALAREAVSKEGAALGALVTAFGPGILKEDGELDRDALAALVFADAKARSTVNRVIHPEVVRLSEERFVRLRESPGAFILYEAALLIETKRHTRFSGLVVVDCPPDVQLQRLVEKRTMRLLDAKQRLAAQVTREERLAAATYVIGNEGSLQALELEVRKAFADIVATLRL